MMRSNSPRRTPGTTRGTNPKPSSRRPGPGRSSTKPSSGGRTHHNPADRSRRPSPGRSTGRGQGNERGTDSTQSLRPPKRIISPAKKSVMFSLDAPDRKSVAVAGAFNDWSPQEMAKGPDGVWRTTVQLAHGTYEYRFLADGDWMQDPNNPRRQANDIGGYNSVCNVL